MMLAAVIAAIGALALFAQMIPDPLVDPGAFVALLGDLAHRAAWAPLIALAVVGIVAALRAWGAPLIPWLSTRRGTLTLAGLSALALSVGQQLLIGEASILSIAVTAIAALFTAIGIHSGATNAAKGGAAGAGAGGDS